MTVTQRERVKRAGKACWRACHVGLRGAAFGGAALSTLALGLFAVLGADGISLSLLRPTVEGIVKERTGAQSVSVGSIRLIRDRTGDAPLRMTVTDIDLDHGANGRLAIPGVSMRLAMSDLMRGQAMPRHVEISGADIEVERRGGEISLGGTGGDGEPLDVGGLVAQARSAGFEGAMLHDLDLTYINAETGARFEARNGIASLSSNSDGYAFHLSVPNENDEQQLILDLYASPERDRVEGILTAVTAPADTVLSLILGGGSGITFDAGISGTLTAEGSLQSGFTQMGMALHVGEGLLKVQQRQVEVSHVTVNSVYDPVANRLSLGMLDYDLAGNSGVLSGEAQMELTDGAISGATFELLARDVITDPDGLLPEALPVADARALGRYDLTNDTFFVDELDAEYFGARVRGNLSYAMPVEPGQSPGLKGSLVIEGELTPQQVLRGWPVAMGVDAREWVVEYLPQAVLSGVTYEMDMPRGALSGGGASDDYLNLKFRARNATIIYVPGMTPIRGLDATAVLRGNSFFVDASGGAIGPVKVTGGSIRMEELVPKGRPAYYQLEVAGEIADILTIVDEEPLGYLTEAGLDPKDFSGQGTFDLTLMRPMLSEVPIEDYEFDGKGTFTDLALPSIGPGLPLTDGTGNVTLTEKGLSITGTVDVEDIPARFTWRRFFSDDERLTLDASFQLDPGSADAIGLPLRRFVRGTMDATLAAEGADDHFDRMEFRADLTRVALTSDDETFLKQHGEPGEAVVIARPGAEGEPVDIETFRLSMAKANIEGNARFTPQGALVYLDLPRLFMEGMVDLSARLAREDDSLRINIEGEYANLGPMIDQLLQRSGGGEPIPGEMLLNAHLNRVGLKGGVNLRNVMVEGRHDQLGTRSASARGAFADGGTLSLDIASNPSGIGKDVRLVTDQFGTMLQGLFGIGSVKGGEAMLTATAINDGPVAGTIQATDIRIQNAPTVARLLSVGSLDGLANVLNGEGLEFSELQGDVQIDQGILRLVDARLTGSALGVSANGAVDMQNGQFGLHGAVAPAYSVNSFLGELPGLGDLLVSRDGEGVIAFAYRVDGPVAEPTITVNTLTALTPGIFRRIFEPLMDEEPSTVDLLNAAEVAAGEDEARDFLSTPELLREYEAHRRKVQDPPDPPR